jgi:hypothetical protein
MAIQKLAPNIPVDINVQYCDIVPGNFGPQVRLKGSIDGEESLVFLPGKVWANLKALRSAGAIDASQEVNEEPEKAEAVAMLAKSLRLNLVKGASDKYANLDVRIIGNGAPKPAPSSNGTPKSTAPVASALSQNEHNVGWLPGDEVETGGAPGGVTPFDGLLERYGECLTEAAGFGQRINKLGIPIDGSAVAAIAATIFIARNQKGV